MEKVENWGIRANYAIDSEWHDPCSCNKIKKEIIYMPTLLWVLLVFLLLGALPVYPYSSSWGYYPSGGLGLVLIILLVVVLLRG